MSIVIAIALGFVLDLILGDPRFLIHPVQIIGWFITDIKKFIFKILYGCSYKEMQRRRKRTKKKRKKTGEYLGGFLLLILIVPGTYIVVWQILNIAGMIHPYVRLAVEVLLVYQILATKSLKKESMKVYRQLKAGNLKEARKELSYLVGRDTEQLDQSEVAKADVETIAENTADGIVAPLFFVALGGAPLGFAYKAVNTLDSMVGYRNAECRYIGFASAKMDDLCNFIPSRLAALMMIIAGFMLKLDGRGAMRIFLRDRYNHLSPNSAQTEAVAAGALRIQLGGTHTYFGKPVVKPTIGDDLRPVVAEDIKTTNNLMYLTAFLSMLLCLGLAALIHIAIL